MKETPVRQEQSSGARFEFLPVPDQSGALR